VTVDTGDGLDSESAVALTRTFEPADGWMARLEHLEPPLPAAGSDLAADDQATHPRRVSHLAFAAISAAVDHFHASRTLISAGHVIHLNAQFTLLRAALENAATAVYLLAPDDRNTRLLRSLRVAWADVSDEHGLREQLRKYAQKAGQAPVKDASKSLAAWKGRAPEGGEGPGDAAVRHRQGRSHPCAVLHDRRNRRERDVRRAMGLLRVGGVEAEQRGARQALGVASQDRPCAGAVHDRPAGRAGTSHRFVRSVACERGDSRQNDPEGVALYDQRRAA
jgi:hypothetical protein